MTARYIIADVFDGIAALEDGSVDLVLSSPPFLALRSYLPADHPDKSREIGSEPTPEAFIDRLLDVVEALTPKLAAHGSICFELGDTYSGSGGSGGDYLDGGRREGQAAFSGAAATARSERGRTVSLDADKFASSDRRPGWPLAKSLCLIPESFRWALVYGRNPFNGRTTERWRARNVIRWVRPNPPVGALGDKFRPATSEMVVVCKSPKRWFDLDAVRNPDSEMAAGGSANSRQASGDDRWQGAASRRAAQSPVPNPAGAPPLDWWEISTESFSGVWKGDTLYRASRDCPDHSLRALRQRLQTAGGGELREILLRNSRRTDIGRALAQLCAQSAKSDLDNPVVCRAMTDWLDQSIRDEQTTGSTAASKTPTLRPGDSPLPAAKTAARTSGTRGEPTSPDQTWEMLPLEYAPAATTRNTASNKTGPAPATTSPGTPSAGTPADIGDTSTSPALSAPRPDTAESSTSEACPDADEPRTAPRIAGSPSSRCSCEKYTESGSHYATFPRALLDRPILAMCPRRVCTVCGEPSRRIVETTNAVGRAVRRTSRRLGPDGAGDGRVGVMDVNDAPDYSDRTALGWSECDCPAGDGDKWRRGVVLDPFGGSGTTGAVALAHGRDSVMIDIDERNATLARDRIGMFLSVEYLGRQRVV